MPLNIERVEQVFTSAAAMAPGPALADLAPDDMRKRIDDLTPKLQAQPGDAQLWAARARPNGVAVRFRECAADYAKAIELNPADRWWWLQNACVLAANAK